MSTRIDCPDGYITFDIQEFNLTEKVASFDYDHTLVKPNHGTFSRNADDWVWHIQLKYTLYLKKST